MKTIARKARLIAAFLLVLSAGVLGGCSQLLTTAFLSTITMGTFVTEEDMNKFTVGTSTSADVAAELGEVKPSGEPEAKYEVWSYILTQKELDDLESYLDEGEELDKVMDLDKYLYKQYVYMGAGGYPDTRGTLAYFVFDPDGILVGKEYFVVPQAADSKETGKAVSAETEKQTLDFVEKTNKKYHDAYGTKSVAKVKAELIKIKGSKKKRTAKKK